MAAEQILIFLQFMPAFHRSTTETQMASINSPAAPAPALQPAHAGVGSPCRPMQRPWQGAVEKEQEARRPAYDPQCYLCPGNERAEPPAGGPRPRNPQFTGTYVFRNDFSALLPDAPDTPADTGHDLLVAQPERGQCRVVVFSPRHDLTLAEMGDGEIRAVVDTWAERRLAGPLPYVNHVQILRTRAIMGAAIPIPTGRSAQKSADGPAKELASMAEYRRARGGACLLCDYLAEEARRDERLVCANRHFTALVPFWAVWPFETMILSHRHVTAITHFSDEERDALAEILRRLTTRYDNVFEVSFPYSMGIHQAPTDGREHPECHFHMHFYPPLLRSAKVKKFMVGY